MNERRLVYVYRLRMVNNVGTWVRESAARATLVYTGRINTSDGEMVTLRFRQKKGYVQPNAFETVLCFPAEWNGLK